MASRTICPFCGASAPAEGRYCSQCGTPLNQERLRLSTRHRERTSGRIAVWAFLLVVLLVFFTGTLGGYTYERGRFPPVPPSRQTTGPVNEPDRVAPPIRVETGTAYLPAVVSINVRDVSGNKAGSGFILDDAGHVVTNEHVVAGTRCVEVVDNDGQTHMGRVIGSSVHLDVALIRVPTLEDWPSYLELGEAAALRPGDEVFIVGSPKGVGNSVPQRAEVVRFDQGRNVKGRYYRRLLQLTGAIVLEGSSGGPVVAADTGRAVGLVTIGAEGAPISWAVPSDDVADQIRAWTALPSDGACESEPALSSVPVKLAVITPRSGVQGVFGTDLAEGAALALRDLDPALRRVGYEVSLETLDDIGSSAIAREQAQRAVYDPNVIGVVGSLDSAVTFAIAEELAPSGLVMVAPTAGAAELTAAGWPHFNRLVASANRLESTLAWFADQRLQVDSVYLITEDSQRAARQAARFETAAQVLGIRVAGRSKVVHNYTELKERLADSAAEAVYLATDGRVAYQLVQGLRREGVTLPVLGGESLYDQAFEALRGSGAERVYFARRTAEPSEQFRRRFEDTMGKPTRGYAAYGYDAASVILEALIRYGKEHPGEVPPREELARMVRDTRAYRGWTSWITFDEAGENISSWIYLFEWRQGHPTLVEDVR